MAEINTNLDTTPLPPNNLVAQDPQSAELAGYVRTKTFGRDVRESIARSIELNSTRSKNAEELANETLAVTETATSNMANQVELIKAEKDAVIANATVDSEVILARGDKATLGQRLDETDAQLVQNVNYIEEKNKDMKGDLISDFVRLGNLQTFKDAVAKGYCRIAWFGDSYFGGGDYVDVNDRHVEQYQQILKNAYPNVVFEFSNFGLGGRTIENAVDSGYTSPDDFEISWANVAGKSWRNYVKDYNPHLVFICFGMNVPTGGGKKTSYYMELLRTWINTWVNTPSLVFLNNPIPNKSWAVDWKEREIASRQVSLFCKKNNFTLFDAFNKYRTLVDGVDENKTTKTRYTGTNELSLNGQIYTTSYQAKDFKLKANITITASNAFSVYFRSGGSIVVDANKIIGTDIPTINLDGSTGTFELTVELGDNLKIMINDTVHYDETFYAYVTFSEIAFGYTVGTGTVSNINITSNHPNQTSAGFTVEDFYGKYVAGDFGLKLPTGGNGVNHPSSVGYNYFYVPLIYEFTNKFNSTFKKESTVQKTFNLTLSNDLDGHSYANLPTGVTVPYLGGVLENPEGIIFKERKDVFWITNPPTVFSDNEYLVRRTGAITQLLLPRQTTLTGWKYTTNVSM